ncbi:hypothetical protein ABZ848_28440 [Streptomyces sp. NPDC047081]|uniref:hypothetical protein n=1 Tax=Streptomyces sp. NPDC047081 TaxID=3154706 RepID=UPI0033E585A8
MALLLLTACGGQSAKDEAAGSDRSADPGDPATWVLPLQAYLPDPEQEDLLFQSLEDAKAACMARFGFDYRPAKPLPDFGPDTLTDLRYGIHDRQVAETYGYKPAGDMDAYQEEMRQAMEANTLTAAEEAAMTGEGGGKAELPEGGCAGEAHRRIYGTDDQVSTLAMDLSNQAYTKAKKTEPVQKVFRSWSQCMAKRGYSYDEPLDAPSDPAFAAPKAEPAEIATALADLECRDEYRVAEVWFDTETRLQRELAEQHIQELQEAGQVLETALKAAARTKATGS